jgi:hypothetical protein
MGYVSSADMGATRVSRGTLVDRERSAWDEEARRIIRGEMGRRSITYKELAFLLEPHAAEGERITERNLISRITRGTFTFGFAIQILRAMGATEIDIRPVETGRARVRTRSSTR